MKVLALHGFLGEGLDWQALKARASSGIEWICPDLFHPESQIQFSSFDSFVESLLDFIKVKKVDVLVGYSFGGRMAVEIIKRRPDFADQVLVLSAHLGGMTQEQHQAKRKNDSAWAMRFLSEAWDKVLTDWNQQSVFAGDENIVRDAANFDRRKLYLALENLSVAEQGMFLDVPEALRQKFQFYVGEKDTKYAQLFANYQKADWISSYQLLPAGHRLHLEAVKPLAEGLKKLKK